MKCEEAAEEPATESTEKFYQLSCFIEKGMSPKIKHIILYLI